MAGRRQMSPERYRSVTLAALVALVAIVLTGVAVRLTGSGLGCSDWPTCEDDRLVAPLEFHAWVEFGNRLVTGVVSAAVIAAVLGARWRNPYRRDLSLLAWGLVAGVVAQVILGGITVLTHLSPPVVMAHFLLSMVLVANAVVLHWRAAPRRDVDPGTTPPLDRRPAGAVVVLSAVAVFTGTIVTAAGPHGGDEEVERLDVALPDVARVHGISVVLLIGVVLATLWWIGRRPERIHLLTPGRHLLTALIAQGAIGYVQYFTGVPVVLVGLHVLGATVSWILAVRLWLAVGEPGPTTAPPHRPDDTRAAALA